MATLSYSGYATPGYDPTTVYVTPTLTLSEEDDSGWVVVGLLAEWAVALTPYDPTAQVVDYLSESVTVGLTIGGASVGLLGFQLRIGEGDACWTGQLELPDSATWLAVGEDAAIVLTIGTESYSLIADGKQHSQAGITRPSHPVAVISPVAQLAAPRDTPADYSWPDDTLASSVIATMANGFPVALTSAFATELAWEEWTIPGGRLEFTAATRLEMLQSWPRSAAGWRRAWPTAPCSCAIGSRWRSPTGTPPPRTAPSRIQKS